MAITGKLFLEKCWYGISKQWGSVNHKQLIRYPTLIQEKNGLVLLNEEHFWDVEIIGSRHY